MGKILFFVCLPTIFLSAQAHASSLDATQAAVLFREGNALFRKANDLAGAHPKRARDLYRKSVMRFEKIIREGKIHNGKIYYNIGNAYFRMNDLGRAILNYRRAGQYIPNDPNLRQNVSYARARRLDRIQTRQETRVLETLFFWHYDLSGKTRSAVFAGAFILLWGFASLRVFVRRPFSGWGVVISGMVALLFLGSLLVDLRDLHGQRPGVIVQSEVVARKGDSETYAKSFREPLHAGTEFDLLEDRGDWIHVMLRDERECWLPKKSVEMVREEAAGN